MATQMKMDGMGMMPDASVSAPTPKKKKKIAGMVSLDSQMKEDEDMMDEEDMDMDEEDMDMEDEDMEDAEDETEEDMPEEKEEDEEDDSEMYANQTAERKKMRMRRLATMGYKSADFDEEAFVCSFDRKVYPGGATVCVDVNSVLLTSSGSIDTYQWQSSTNDVVFTNIGGATSATYTVTNINQTSYYRLVSSNGTCPAATSSSVAVTTVPRPTASLSGSAEICVGNSSSLSIALAGSGPWSGTLSNGQVFSSAVNPAIVKAQIASDTSISEV
jgi:hypothetical protein